MGLHRQWTDYLSKQEGGATPSSFIWNGGVVLGDFFQTNPIGMPSGIASTYRSYLEQILARGIGHWVYLATLNISSFDFTTINSIPYSLELK